MLAAGIYFAGPHQWTVEETLHHMDEAGTAMQMLSYVPGSLRALRSANDYGAQLVADHPDRFGLLAALPTDDPDDAIAEVSRTRQEHRADGFAVTARYGGVHLGDPSLRPLWHLLDEQHAVVFVHPDARLPPVLDHPVPLYEVAFETTRTIFDMIFRRVIADFPNVTFVVAHCGGGFPALTGRLRLLGNESWVPHGIEAHDVDSQAARLYVDTAASATPHTLLPAAAVVGAEHIVYGSDWGAPCTTPATAAQNLDSLLHHSGLPPDEAVAVLDRGWELFPAALERRTRAS